MKNIIIKIGNLVAILLMFSPLIILYNYKSIGNTSFLLFIISICYDVFMYSVINKQNFINNIEIRYNKMLKLQDNFVSPDGKILTNQNKIEIMKDFIEEIIKKLK